MDKGEEGCPGPTRGDGRDVRVSSLSYDRRPLHDLVTL